MDGQLFTQAELRDASERRLKICAPPLSLDETQGIDTLNQSGPGLAQSDQSTTSSPLMRRRLRSNVVNEITEIPQPSDDVDSQLSAGKNG